jgi:ATP-binding cassette subfamily B protein
MNKKEFNHCWPSTLNDGIGQGIALLLSPTPKFYKYEDDGANQKRSLLYFLHYLYPYKSQIIQLIIGMLLASLFSLILPFLTQAVVDQGINSNNLNFVTLIIVAQLTLSITQTSVTFLQNWITLNMNTRISITLLSDFLAKLMRLPIRFFDTKNIEDIMQRIGNHSCIQSFMAGSTLMTLFSFLNFFALEDTYSSAMN